MTDRSLYRIMSLISYYILTSCDGESIHRDLAFSCLCSLFAIPDSAEPFEDFGI